MNLNAVSFKESKYILIYYFYGYIFITQNLDLIYYGLPFYSYAITIME